MTKCRFFPFRCHLRDFLRHFESFGVLCIFTVVVKSQSTQAVISQIECQSHQSVILASHLEAPVEYRMSTWRKNPSQRLRNTIPYNLQKTNGSVGCHLVFQKLEISIKSRFGGNRVLKSSQDKFCSQKKKTDI